MNGLTVDLLVVGGGIHGAGIARDAAGRGLSVLLAEQGDLAGATSSASSKLAHGGLRYLELGDFRLVREALQERLHQLEAQKMALGRQVEELLRIKYKVLGTADRQRMRAKAA